MTLKQVIEALVFASPKPLLTKEIVAALRSAGEETEDLEALAYAKVGEEEVLAALEELKAEYTQAGRPFQVTEQINGWTLVTDSGAGRWVRQLYPEAKPTRLSGPALETLAIIAYRQPVTRADIEAVRGVAVDGVMQVLLERGLVKIAGRAEVPGRPLLYSTTEYFLQHFGLKNVDDLPNAGELRRIPLPTAPPPTEEEAAAAKPKKKKKGESESEEAEKPAETSSEGTAATQEVQSAAEAAAAETASVTESPAEETPKPEPPPAEATTDLSETPAAEGSQTSE